MAATVQRPGLLEQNLGRKKNFNVQESITREPHLPATQAPTKSARHVGCTSRGELDLGEEDLPGNHMPWCGGKVCQDGAPSALVFRKLSSLY